MVMLAEDEQQKIDISSIAPNSNDKDNIDKVSLASNSINDNVSIPVLASNENNKSEEVCISSVVDMSTKEEPSCIQTKPQLSIASSTMNNNMDCITHQVSFKAKEYDNFVPGNYRDNASYVESKESNKADSQIIKIMEISVTMKCVNMMCCWKITNRLRKIHPCVKIVIMKQWI